MPTDSRNCKSQTESCSMTGGGEKMLAAFCLIVLFIFCGLFLGLIEVACAKNAEKKVRLIDKRRFGKMVDEEAKKRIKNT